MAVPKGNQGIYKITSPSGRVYVGQSIDLLVRFSKYRSMNCRGQVRLYNSFRKYGVENHAFIILEWCTEIQMNQKERFYQDYYNVIGKEGLNCKLTATDELKGWHSAETKRKIAKSNTGKKPSEETLKKMRGRLVSAETRKILSEKNKGKKASEETKAKMRQRMKGNSYTRGMRPVNARKVKCTRTGTMFNSAYEAAEAIGMKRTTLGAMLRETNRNTTYLRYV